MQNNAAWKNSETDACCVYKPPHLVIIIFANMLHRWDTSDTQTYHYNIQNHVQRIKLDLWRHVSSEPMFKKFPDENTDASTAAHLKPHTHLSSTEEEIGADALNDECINSVNRI